MRIFALILDFLILAILGAIIGTLFTQKLVELSYYGRIIGFIIVLFYFGILNSHLGKGQTLGKKILHIRVVDGNGQYISIIKSALRAVILVIPFFLNGLPFPPYTWLLVITMVLILGGGVAIFYLYIFNKNTRQSLHDLICQTYVVYDNYHGEIKTDPVNRVHYIVISLILVVSFILPFVINQLWGSTVNQFYKIQNNLYQVNGVLNSTITVGINYYNGEKNTYALVNVNVDDKMKAEGIARNVMNKIIAKKYFFDKDKIGVVTIYGYDIGIWSYSEKRQYWHDRQEWEGLK